MAKPIFKIVVLPLLLLLSIPTNASTIFKCKGKHIEGLSKFDVLRYCGKPVMKDSYHKSGRGSHAKNIIWDEVQQWFYTRGPGNTSYTIEFENGRVARIIKGESSP